MGSIFEGEILTLRDNFLLKHKLKVHYRCQYTLWSITQSSKTLGPRPRPAHHWIQIWNE